MTPTARQRDFTANSRLTCGLTDPSACSSGQTQDVGEGGFEWWGIVGPQPLPEAGGLLVVSHDSGRKLSGPVTLGPLRLTTGGTAFVEWFRTDPVTLDGTYCFESWPIVAEGATRGGERHLAERSATMLLHRLASLLAVAWDEPWQTRSAPRDRTWALPGLPESWPPPPRWRDRAPARPGVDHQLPPWLDDDLWSRLDSAPRLRCSASVWQQALLLMPSHPSFALVGFVGVLEQLADQLQLPNDTASERVAEAIKRVATDDEAKLLAPAYRDRSRTAHGGGLSLLDESLGARLSFEFVPPEGLAPAQFIPEPDGSRHDILRRLQVARTVSRRLLLRTLEQVDLSSDDLRHAENDP